MSDTYERAVHDTLRFLLTQTAALQAFGDGLRAGGRDFCRAADLIVSRACMWADEVSALDVRLAAISAATRADTAKDPEQQ